MNGSGASAQRLHRFARAVAQRYGQCRSFTRVVAARLQGVTIGAGTRIDLGAEFTLGSRVGDDGRLEVGHIELGEAVELHRFVSFKAHGGHIRLGSNVFIGTGAVIFGHGGVDIGSNSLISMQSRILSSNHTVPDFGVDVRSMPDVLLKTIIGRDVWLGAGVTVLGGVTVGDGAVVSAGAVVTRDLPKGSYSAGVPARVYHYRRGARKEEAMA
jgi:acetyltransferase-like isoleucine patch superfamily enzyme